MTRARGRAVFPPLFVGLVLGSGCSRAPSSSRDDGNASAASGSAPSGRPGDAAREPLAMQIYRGGLKEGWQDQGWCPRKTTGPGPAELHFAGLGGFILAKPGFSPDAYGALVFRMQPPKGERDFLEVRVESSSNVTFPRVKVASQHETVGRDGWIDVRVPMFELDPEETRFDRIVLRAYREVDDEVTLLDDLGFTQADGSNVTLRLSAGAYATTSKPVRLVVSCDAKATRISPLVYGNAYYPITDESKAQWSMGATVRRWGGNTASRYNWEQSVWNLDADWFFENKPIDSWEKFLDADDAHGMASVITVLTLGWVAKDGTSYSFPVSAMGKQGKTDPNNPDIGDGTAPDGKKLTPGPATRTSIQAPPAFVKRWVEAVRAREQKRGKKSVVGYILDNEPMAWSKTHRDVRTEPLGFDELVDRAIEYGTAIREADPAAVIAGPAEWGWTGYFYSGKDEASGFMLRPDRRAHGDLPVVEYYLRKLAEHERKTGVRVLDVLDLHFYPAAPNVFEGNGGGGTDSKTAGLRLRSTRGLWDPSYTDESWIKEPVRLLPRMREWIDKNYPGRGISIGEWNFGGEAHVSGALAIAEALGRFGQYGVYSAYYWSHPPEDSPGLYGFLAYHGFDGKDGRFLDYAVPATGEEGVSVFASRDTSGDHAVLVLVNMSSELAGMAKVELKGCGPVTSAQPYTYMRGLKGFIPGPAGVPGAASLDAVLPPWSITVLDVHVKTPMSGALADPPGPPIPPPGR